MAIAMFAFAAQTALQGAIAQGAMNLTDLEIKRGVAYMVNQSGGKWVEPVSTKSPPVARTGEEIVKAQCIKCHQAGTGGAPRIGDRDAWIPRLKDGLDGAVRSAMKGHGTEPHAGTGGYSSTNAVLLI